MPASISVSSLTWSTPDGRAVLSGLDLSFPPVRTGIVGRNGSGKTTLLRLLAGDLAPNAGTVTRNATISTLRQVVARSPAETLAQALGLAEPLALLRRAQQGVATEDDLAAADWTLESRFEAALSAAGLYATAETQVATLSGGQQTRAGLAAAILADPDFLLLDEPTNNLDAEGRAALATFLASWRKGAIVVSHDRALLEGMDAIVELTSLGATRYGGPYSHYRERKALELAAAEAARDHAEQALREVRNGAQTVRERKDRRDGAGVRKARRGDMPRILIGARRQRAENTTGQNARQAERLETEASGQLAQARARLEVIEPLVVDVSPTGLAPARMVLQLSTVTAGHGDAAPVLVGIDLTITGPERVAVTGPNGVGKSTLLALIRGTLPPRSGSVRVSVPLAVLDQHASLLNPAESVVANLRRLKPGLDENAARAALARLRFRTSGADQPAGTLSGGQAMRAALACVLADTPPPLLLLDEPTNHLDLDAIAAIEAGLAAYDGALIVVSHDEAFLQAIGVTRRIALTAPA
ncbi:ABC-F family ATP-binding cassette domain-containing protein [Novosphingobium percolationis]|uniref:ABC-F family ATP-binding cassette domain-containing protein n=1 Tax=Novosphingobium percolationis TaxID=2871811 RepID=UPI001CD2E12D|nr:ABC-F family ATP-binding cassette domain-containing protein [Novosphingobium percolationis]